MAGSQERLVKIDGNHKGTDKTNDSYHPSSVTVLDDIDAEGEDEPTPAISPLVATMEEEVRTLKEQFLQADYSNTYAIIKDAECNRSVGVAVDPETAYKAALAQEVRIPKQALE